MLFVKAMLLGVDIRQTKIANIRRHLLSVNGDGIARSANRRAASGKKNVMEAVVRASSGHQVDNAVITFNKLAIPNVQFSRSKPAWSRPNRQSKSRKLLIELLWA